MAVSSEALCSKEFFASLGMLIIQGRKWDAFRRIRGRGLHCPTVRNSSPPHHHCSLANLECQRALSFRHSIETIWHHGEAVTIEVILLPECGHAEQTLLLERWTLKNTNELSKMNELSLMQAIDSTIHFSQLSSWWSSTNGSMPKNVQYKVYERKEHGENVLEFCDATSEHQFAPCNGVNVHLRSLRRQSGVPKLHCESCTIATRPVDMHFRQIRGRSFLQKRSCSRHSSTSSDSLSPSAARFDGRSPLGSPLLPFRMTLSSSSSSRESSRAPSPCLQSPDTRASQIFQTSDVLSEENEAEPNEMDAMPMNQSIDQDEELANQLDSLSDSDLSDDYVIDGPVGSPGLVGTPIASPDDSRVQILQSTFAGFHCRHPAFDRLMGDGSGETRTRHASLDSAVSNLEKLDLEARRKLSRTSSDGQNFEKLKEIRKNSVEPEFFIRQSKKRHKPCDRTDSPSVLNSVQCSSSSCETFYASFQNDPNIGLDFRQSSKTDHFPPSDQYGSAFHYDYNSFRPTCNSTLSTVGYLAVEYPADVPRPISPIHKPMSVFKEAQEHDEMKHSMSNSMFSNQLSTYSLLEHDGSVVSHANANLDETPLSLSIVEKYGANTTSCDICKEHIPCVGWASVKKHDCSQNTTTREMNIQQRRRGSEDDLKLNLEHLDDERDSKGIRNSTPSLLRSPPSKLRVLPSNCVEKKYEHNPRRDNVHKLSQGVAVSTARKLQFNHAQDKPVCTSPAPIRRNNSVRFEFDEDMSKLNQRSSRSVCRRKCMKRNGIIVHNHNHLMQASHLLGSFEESIIHNRLEVLGSVDGFQAQLGASGSFCPPKVKLPVPVCFFHVSDDNAPSPYMGTMSLKGKECAKRGYHIPRKGTIQLTLFNPNNSVVKVFVILYDVSDMPPGHRTFLRHRIFSRPVLEDTDTASKHSICQNQPNSKLLRYFVHLWLESSKTNKIYIHGDIKILFSLASNEWDSGNTFELQTETEFPKEPRYSSKR